MHNKNILIAIILIALLALGYFAVQANSGRVFSAAIPTLTDTTTPGLDTLNILPTSSLTDTPTISPTATPTLFPTNTPEFTPSPTLDMTYHPSDIFIKFSGALCQFGDFPPAHAYLGIMPGSCLFGSGDVGDVPGLHTGPNWASIKQMENGTLSGLDGLAAFGRSVFNDYPLSPITVYDNGNVLMTVKGDAGVMNFFAIQQPNGKVILIEVPSDGEFIGGLQSPQGQNSGENSSQPTEDPFGTPVPGG